MHACRYLSHSRASNGAPTLPSGAPPQRASCCPSSILGMRCIVPLRAGIRHPIACMQVPVPLQGHPPGRLLCPAAHHHRAQAAARVLGLPVPGAHPGRVPLRPPQPLHRRLPRRGAAARSPRGRAARHCRGRFPTTMSCHPPSPTEQGGLSVPVLAACICVSLRRPRQQLQASVPQHWASHLQTSTDMQYCKPCTISKKASNPV